MNTVQILLQMDWSKYLALALQFLGALHLALVFSAMFFALIPGAEPERTLYKMADLIAKVSRK